VKRVWVSVLLVKSADSMTFSVCALSLAINLFLINFVARYITPRPGRIVHMETGKPIGTHNGLWNYTIGQGAKLPGHSQPLFVASKDTDNNELLVVPGS
jgi:tRNA U34 2-thiouridine synthase MnmA/TrmU